MLLRLLDSLATMSSFCVVVFSNFFLFLMINNLFTSFVSLLVTLGPKSIL